MKKYIKIAIGLYVSIASLLYLYIFYFSDTSVQLHIKEQALIQQLLWIKISCY